jgi:hypothetical protein
MAKKLHICGNIKAQFLLLLCKKLGLNGRKMLRFIVCQVIMLLLHSQNSRLEYA